MQMLYNSDSFTVLQLELHAADSDGDGSALQRGGFDIVDKFARKQVFIEGALADSFQQGVQALVAAKSDGDAFDDFIGSYTVLAQQPLLLH